MDWIKRNLMFVIGAVVALALMGLAGFYLYSSMGKNAAAFEKLDAEYHELERLNRQSPHPGNEKTDNIKAARQEQQEVRAFIGQTAKVFKPIPRIPDATNINNAMLAGALRRTIDEMRKEAARGGVELATNYYFSFTAERDRIMFDRAGVPPLATQLGEVKAICDILFAARINALDGIRRERVSVHDNEAQATTDYLDRTTVTNDVALISPYEVSIRCFSSELAGVLSGFASSPYGFIVRGINVEPAAATGMMGGEPGVNVDLATPTYVLPPAMPESALNRRYGARYGAIPGEGGYPRRPVYAPVAAPTAVPGRGGLPTLLDEKQLRATLLIEVVKLTSKK